MVDGSSRRQAGGARRAAPEGMRASGRKVRPRGSGVVYETRSWRNRWRQLTGRQKAGRIALMAAIPIVGLLLIGLVLGVVYYQKVSLPDPNAEYQTATTTLYYRDGTTQLGQLAVQNRIPLSYADMPQSMKDAVVAAEDRTFWTNRGISLPGMVRAMWNMARGGEVQSGSTLTQQYIKTLYLTSAQTASRKMKELVLSMKMTNTMPKEKILAGYLNTVYFGRGAYGIQAAAKAYFDVDAKDLTVPQAAVLTCQLNGPSLYDPSDPADATRLMERYNYVLDGMVATGALPQADADRYKDHLPDFPKIPTSDRYGGPTGFLMSMAEAEMLKNGFTEDQINGGGYKVITTFDAAMQAAAVSSAQSFTETAASKAREPQDPNNLHAAIASVGVGTGEVLALYGGPDYVKSQMNWANIPRQTGSTFKAFAFVAGERGGLGLNSMLTGDPIRVGGQNIHNDGYAKYGPVNLLQATQNSVNTAFVDLTQQIKDGPNQVIKAATDAGLTPNDTWQAVPVVALGVAEASPLEMAGAYSTIANGGVLVPTHVVSQVIDRTGTVLYSANATGRPAIEAAIAADLTYALQSVVDSGTGTAARALKYPVAGKTGTAGGCNGKDDGGGVCAAWFVGFTKQISTAVMYVAGGGSNTDDLNAYAPRNSSNFFGGGYPAQTWADYMKQAMDGLPVVNFGPPSNINNIPTPTPTDQPVGPPESPTDTPSVTPTGPTDTVPPTTEPPTSQPATTAPTTAPPTETPSATST